MKTIIYKLFVSCILLALFSTFLCCSNQAKVDEKTSPLSFMGITLGKQIPELTNVYEKEGILDNNYDHKVKTFYGYFPLIIQSGDTITLPTTIYISPIDNAVFKIEISMSNFYDANAFLNLIHTKYGNPSSSAANDFTTLDDLCSAVGSLSRGSERRLAEWKPNHNQSLSIWWADDSPLMGTYSISKVSFYYTDEETLSNVRNYFLKLESAERDRLEREKQQQQENLRNSNLLKQDF